MSFGTRRASARPGRTGLTVGVEEEFFLVDAEAKKACERSDLIIGAAAEYGLRLDPELKASQVETATDICRSADDLRSELSSARGTAAAAALRHRTLLVASGVMPCDGPPAAPFDAPRYRTIAERYGSMFSEHEISGCHVHVGVPNRESAVQVSNHLRPWLSTLIALTANSPIHKGVDTGFASWRTILASRWCCSGVPPYFDSADHYDSTVQMMIESGAAVDDAMIYWDVRPSARFPTIEVRVSDVPATVDETVLLATLVRALVSRSMRDIENGRPAPQPTTEVLRASYARAARDGLTGQSFDPVTTRRCPAPDRLRALILHVRDDLEDSGDLRLVKTLTAKVLAQGNGAVRQREAFARRHSVDDVIAAAARATVADPMLAILGGAAARSV